MVAGGGSGAGAFAGGAWAARFGAGASGASAGRFLSSAPLRFSASSLACLAASERTKMLVVSCRSVCPCTDQRGLLNFSTHALKEDVQKNAAPQGSTVLSSLCSTVRSGRSPFLEGSRFCLGQRTGGGDVLWTAT